MCLHDLLDVIIALSKKWKNGTANSLWGKTHQHKKLSYRCLSTVHVPCTACKKDRSAGIPVGI